MDTRFDPDWIDALGPVEVYKHDHRSRVWRIDAPDGRSFVVKLFAYNPLRQMLAAALGNHPGQRERRRCGQLIKAALPVVPITASGVKKQGLGLSLWLATPYIGTSLYNLLHKGHLTDPERRGRVMDAVGGVTGELIRKGYFNRDHKASNLLIDADDRPWLIDVGGVRGHHGEADTRRMLGNLRANLAEAGADDADLGRVQRACGDTPAADSTR